MLKALFVSLCFATTVMGQTHPLPPLRRSAPPTPRLVDFNAALPRTNTLAAGPAAAHPTFYVTGGPGLVFRGSAAITYATSSNQMLAVPIVNGSWTIRSVVSDPSRESVASYYFDGTFNEGAVRPGTSGGAETFALYGTTTYGAFAAQYGQYPTILYIRATGTCGSQNQIHFEAWANAPAPRNPTAAAARPRDLYGKGDFVGDVACTNNVTTLRTNLNAH